MTLYMCVYTSRSYPAAPSAAHLRPHEYYVKTTPPLPPPPAHSSIISTYSPTKAVDAAQQHQQQQQTSSHGTIRHQRTVTSDEGTAVPRLRLPGTRYTV